MNLKIVYYKQLALKCRLSLLLFGWNGNSGKMSVFPTLSTGWTCELNWRIQKLLHFRCNACVCLYVCVCVCVCGCNSDPVKHCKGVAVTDKFANYLQKVRGCGRSRTIGQHAWGCVTSSIHKRPFCEASCRYVFCWLSLESDAFPGLSRR